MMTKKKTTSELAKDILNDKTMPKARNGETVGSAGKRWGDAVIERFIENESKGTDKEKEEFCRKTGLTKEMEDRFLAEFDEVFGDKD